MRAPITELEAALARCRADGCTCFIAFYSSKVNVTISKSAYSGSNNTEFTVKGEGDSVAEAFDMAFNNFPKNPLDGASKWVNNRLAAPNETPVDATFTEVKSDDDIQF